jgi:hypothetical protein
MKKLIPALISLCVIFVWIGASPARAQDAAKRVEFDVGPYALNLPSGPNEVGWKLGSASDAHHAAIFEFVRKGDDINTWKELFTYQTFRRKGYPPSPQEYLDALKTLREKECAGATVWNTIEQDENSILYEWQLTKPCVGAPEAQAGVEQHEIARVFYEKDVVFIVHYAAKGHELAPEVRTKWINRWQDTYVTQGNIVNEEVPFPTDKVTAALKSAMEGKGCHVADVTPNQIQCNLSRGNVTAVLTPDGNQTHVRISSRKGAEKSLSGRVYEDMISNLRSAPS